MPKRVLIPNGHGARMKENWVPGFVKAIAVGAAAGLALFLTGCQGVSNGGGSSSGGTQAGALTAAASSLDFGNVPVNGSKTLTVSATNSGSTTLTVSKISIAGPGFSLSGATTPTTLTAGQSATVTVKFAPTAAGAVSGSITIASTASDPSVTVALSGTGTSTSAQLAASPGSLDVGSVVVGTSGSASGSLSATGGTVTVTAAAANNSQFTISGLSLPATIASGQTVPYTVTFSPQASGAVTGTLSFTSDAQNPTATEGLSGTGTPAPSHSVALSWNASTSSSISGYNIYRAAYATSACGAFAKINATLNTTTLYSDASVIDGTAYCYATTAVNTSNEESSYSNIVSNVQIPAP